MDGPCIDMHTNPYMSFRCLVSFLSPKTCSLIILLSFQLKKMMQDNNSVCRLYTRTAKIETPSHKEISENILVQKKKCKADRIKTIISDTAKGANTIYTTRSLLPSKLINDNRHLYPPAGLCYK